MLLMSDHMKGVNMEKILRESLLNELMNDRISIQEFRLPDTDNLTTFIADVKQEWYTKGFQTAIKLIRNGTIEVN